MNVPQKRCTFPRAKGSASTVSSRKTKTTTYARPPRKIAKPPADMPRCSRAK
ncbi:MAG: hypothetical protein ACYS9X_17135 [Planctomycetota bacterium]|jgi:hypothetical protein